jgi:hypothetical protein
MITAYPLCRRPQFPVAGITFLQSGFVILKNAPILFLIVHQSIFQANEFAAGPAKGQRDASTSKHAPTP